MVREEVLQDLSEARTPAEHRRMLAGGGCRVQLVLSANGADPRRTAGPERSWGVRGDFKRDLKKEISAAVNIETSRIQVDEVRVRRVESAQQATQTRPQLAEADLAVMDLLAETIWIELSVKPDLRRSSAGITAAMASNALKRWVADKKLLMQQQQQQQQAGQPPRFSFGQLLKDAEAAELRFDGSELYEWRQESERVYRKMVQDIEALRDAAVDSAGPSAGSYVTPAPPTGEPGTPFSTVSLARTPYTSVAVASTPFTSVAVARTPFTSVAVARPAEEQTTKPTPPAAEKSPAEGIFYVPKPAAPGPTLYVCSLGTGFVGTFDEVQAHERQLLAAQQRKPGAAAPPAHAGAVPWDPSYAKKKPCHAFEGP